MGEILQTGIDFQDIQTKVPRHDEVSLHLPKYYSQISSNGAEAVSMVVLHHFGLKMEERTVQKKFIDHLGHGVTSLTDLQTAFDIFPELRVTPIQQSHYESIRDSMILHAVPIIRMTDASHENHRRFVAVTEIHADKIVIIDTIDGTNSEFTKEEFINRWYVEAEGNAFLAIQRPPSLN